MYFCSWPVHLVFAVVVHSTTDLITYNPLCFWFYDRLYSSSLSSSYCYYYCYFCYFIQHWIIRQGLKRHIISSKNGRSFFCLFDFKAMQSQRNMLLHRRKLMTQIKLWNGRKLIINNLWYSEVLFVLIENQFVQKWNVLCYFPSYPCVYFFPFYAWGQIHTNNY